MAPPKKEFKLTAEDRFVLNDVGPQNHQVFAKHYFTEMMGDVGLFPWQEYFLSYPCKNKLVVAGIRTGKSFIAAFQLLEFAYWNAGSRVLNVCITADQAQIIFQDIINLANANKFLHWVKKIVYHPYPRLELWNGSEIWSRSIGGAGGDASTLRGWEFDVINIDEAAYVVNEFAVRTLQGRLIGVNKVTGRPRFGMLTMTTTPKGAKSWLYERWKLGDPAYQGSQPSKYLSIRARTYDNTLLDPAAIEMALADYTEKQRQQELEGIFISDDGLFQLEDLVACAGKDLGAQIIDLQTIDVDIIELEKSILAWLSAGGKKVEDIPQTITFYEVPPIPGHTYVAGWDLGARTVITGVAEGRNSTVGAVFDITYRPWRMVAYRYDTQGRYTISMERVKEWHDLYNSNGGTCHTRIDALGPGDVIHQMLEEDAYRIDGFKAGTISKGVMLQASSVIIERRHLRWPFIRRVIDQFQTYTPNDKNIAQDTVIAISQAIHLAREIEGGVTEMKELTVYRGRGASMAGHRQAIRDQRTGRGRWR
jgi:hypothetical protein